MSPCRFVHRLVVGGLDEMGSMGRMEAQTQLLKEFTFKHRRWSGGSRLFRLLPWLMFFTTRVFFFIIY